MPPFQSASQKHRSCLIRWRESSIATPLIFSRLGALKLPVRILIVDDHEIVREGIRMLIRRSRPEWEICGEASNGEEAIAAIQSAKPDVVVLDLTMPKLSGMEVAAKIAGLKLSSRILIFTMHETERLCSDVRASGAQGFVLKSQAARDLIRAIDCLLGGGTFFGSEFPPKSDPQLAVLPGGAGKGIS